MFGGGEPFDFHLHEGSPCIDAGIDVGFPYFGLAPDMGAYEFDPSAANPDDSELIPQTFHLYQNYPNPFNSATTIRFDLPQAGEVKLVVYDILGREAAVIADGFYPAGYYSAVFDGLDLASGIYLVRLTVDGGQLMGRKVILVK